MSLRDCMQVLLSLGETVTVAELHDFTSSQIRELEELCVLEQDRAAASRGDRQWFVIGEMAEGLLTVL